MNVVNIINKAINDGTTRFAFELLPPLKGDGTEGIFRAVENVTAYDPAYINITYHREGLKQTIRPDGRTEWHSVRRRPGTVGIAAAIQKKYGIVTVPHLICGGLSQYDIEDALIDMDFLGLQNVLALRGDCSQNEKVFMPHPQGHSHAVELVRQIAAMNRGEFVDGEVEICHHSRFSIGVAGYPEVHADAISAEDDLLRLKEKIDAGAEYIVTQMFFDNSKFFDFEKRCRQIGINVPIIPGLKPLVNERQLSSLPDIFSISIPDAFRHEITKCGGDKSKVKEVGLEWTITQARELKAAGVPVLHFYTMSRTENIARIAKEVF
ncbi:MAG: methylenetetrahydrofolate reductase [Muribaculaceae bacterium]|nr:methylenetetrahydrofolate reductase [Muribaculaceae bacterium]